MNLVFKGTVDVIILYGKKEHVFNLKIDNESSNKEIMESSVNLIENWDRIYSGLCLEH